MSIVIIRGDQNYKPWLESFKEIAPTLPIFTPEKIRHPEEIEVAWTWKAPPGSFDTYPNLKIVGSLGAGVDHLFTDSLPSNLKITRVVDPYLTEDMAEFVLTLCLNHLKKLRKYTHYQQQSRWMPLSYGRAKETTVGILGLGTLGQATATLLSKNHFKVMGWSKTTKHLEGVESFSEKQLAKMLKKSSILINLLPLTTETHHILNVNLFGQLPSGAHLINVGRGGHLNEDDLLTALDQGLLGSASLDVFNTEPLPTTHPFWEHPEIQITPHIASVSNPASVVPQLIENFDRFRRGTPLLNTVSPKKEY